MYIRVSESVRRRISMSVCEYGRVCVRANIRVRCCVWVRMGAHACVSMDPSVPLCVYRCFVRVLRQPQSA